MRGVAKSIVTAAILAMTDLVPIGALRGLKVDPLSFRATALNDTYRGPPRRYLSRARYRPRRKKPPKLQRKIWNLNGGRGVPYNF